MMNDAAVTRRTAEGPTLFLHIGLPKTASTYLQRRIFPHLDGLLYFDTPQDPAFDGPADMQLDSRIMSCLFSRDPRIWRACGDAVFAGLLGRRADWEPRDVLISDEGIGRTGSRPDLLAAHIAELTVAARDWGLPRVALICAVRRQDHWFGSHYSQISDRNRRASQADFDRAARDLVRVTAERYRLGMLLDYATLYEALAGVTGPENLLMYPFERQKADPDGALAAVLGFLGSRMTPGPAPTRSADSTTATPAGVNVRGVGQDRWSIRPYGPGVRLRPYRIMQHAGLPERVSLPRLFRPRSFALTQTASHTVLAAYVKSNARLASVLGIDLAQYGYLGGVDGPEPVPASSSPAGEIRQTRDATGTSV